MSTQRFFYEAFMSKPEIITFYGNAKIGTYVQRKL